MPDLYFAEASAPPGALRLKPTVQQVDDHPDRDFIWAVILETRAAMREAPQSPSLLQPLMG